MRAWTWPLAAGALLAVAALVAVSSLGPATRPTRDAQAAALAAELRCPDCQSLSVAESQTAAARAIRAEILSQLGAGRTPDQVRQSYVDRYGEWILLRPSAPLAWILPPAVIVVALALVAFWIARRRARPAPVRPSVDTATRRRLDEETEALDA